LGYNNGNLDQAWDFIPQMPPSPERRLSMGKMDTAYAEAGQYSKALQLAQILSDQPLVQLLICAQSAAAKPAISP
jgi:hypothetical protein